MEKSVNFHYNSYATIQMWWNDTDVPDDIINLGNGLYFVSLESITVAPREDPILLNLTISASGYEDKQFETYLGMDPDTLEKEIQQDGDDFPFLIIAIISTVGVIGAIIITGGILRKRKLTKEIFYQKFNFFFLNFERDYITYSFCFFFLNKKKE